MAADFNVESVKQCILDKGGRIRNHELVTHFKNFLNDPVDKVMNREKFKDYVNELATIKVEEGEKVLVLKRKHRPESTISSGSSSSSFSSFSSSSHSTYSSASTDQTPLHPPPAKAPHLQPGDAEGAYPSSGAVPEYDAPQSRQPQPAGDQPGWADRGPLHGEAMRAQSEPPAGGDAGPGDVEEVDGMMMSKVYSDESLDVRLKSSTRHNGGHGPGAHKQSLDASTTSLASSATGSQASLSSSAAEGVSGSGEEEGNVSALSIKERVQHLNKISSESDLQLGRGPAPRKKTVKDRDDDDESHSSGGTSYVTLTPEEKDWMLVSATADYHEMFRLLSKSGQLAKVKDISNGYTALHWAAKFGKPEVVKMLANKIGVNVNQRSNGGYTPLHLAAIHGHEEVIELLVNVYKADANVRDYGGKKPKQYLKNSASSRAQQLLVSTRLGTDFGSARSLDDSFTRLGSARQSNRARVLSSLIQATSSVMRHPMLRSSWDGTIGDDVGVVGERTPGSTPPGSGPASPSSGRKYKDEKSLMPPPPHLPSHRRRRADHARSSSRESLNTQSRSSGAMDKENNNSTTKMVPRSESDPTLTQKSFV